MLSSVRVNAPKQKRTRSYATAKTRELERTYQRIGEFVVSFQWLENRLREIGWLILDPGKQDWPPRSLRDERNRDLITRVETIYLNWLDTLDIKDREERKSDFKSTVSRFHAMREYRNNLLHSAFIELKTVGEVVGMIRSNPRLKAKQTTGDLRYDQEVLSEKVIRKRIGELAQIGFSLNLHYMQAIHWLE